MSIPIVSKKLKEKIIDTAKSMKYNEMRFIYLLRNLGPQQFEKLIEYSGLSRSTVSKYLKIHERHGNIEKRLVGGKQKYCILEKGIERLHEKPNINEIYYRNFDESISKLSEMLEFYKSIGVDEMITLQIVSLASKLGQNFFNIEQNRDLFITLIYIFYNLVITPIYKLRKEPFCEHYNIKKIRLDYHVDQIMSNNLGFFMFTRTYGNKNEEDIFFFHEEDIVGITTLRLVRDKLTEIIIHFNKEFEDRYELKKTSEKYAEIHNIDLMAKEIAGKLKDMKLIWDLNDKDIEEKMKPLWDSMEEVSDDEKKVFGIMEPFEMLIKKIFLKNALEMGFPKLFLMDLVVDESKKLSEFELKGVIQSMTKGIQSDKRFVKSLFNIIDGSERYEDLNLVSIEEPAEITYDDVSDKVKGFCPNCGKSIEKQDLTNICPRCKKGFDPDEILKRIDEANEKSIKYKEMIVEKPVQCQKCNKWIRSTWDECPFCHTIF